MSDGLLTIRPLTAADGPALLAWRNDPSAYRWFRDSRPLTDAEHDAWMSARLADEPPIVWVAELDDRPVGCVRLTPTEGGASVVSIVVDSDVRGVGIGAALLDHCAAVARTRALTDVRAEVRPDNDASLALFTRHGFAETSRDAEFVLLRLL